MKDINGLVKMFEKNGHLHVYSPWAGSANPGIQLLYKHKSSICSFAVSFAIQWLSNNVSI